MQWIEAHRNYVDWITMQRRGRQRIHKAYKDPAAQAKLLADVPPPSFMVELPKHDDMRQALKSLPAYCMPTATSVHCRPPSETPGFSFLGSFPAEVRNAIYQYVVVYPSCREIFDAYYDQVDKFRGRNRSGMSRSFGVRLYTPAILLLCKQITREALSILRLRPFVIDRIPPWVMGDAKPLPLTHLIGESTLQNLRFVEIRLSLGEGEKCISGRIWQQVLGDILKAWSGKNSLVRLRIMIKVNNIEANRHWEYELKTYIEIMNMIDEFAFKHGSRPDLVQYEHWVLDCNYAYKCGFRNPQIRKHPDTYIWQGSGLEWV
ncbi:hypothetical protein GGS21DRAFT_92798 [Xylaria nigripes]|nr:hypothetical protein GGS21DRAFT_92798 [Xylaria nigripes]